MAKKAKIYQEKGIVGDADLLVQLRNAVDELEEKMKTSVPIFKGSVSSIGFGVDKAQRGIAVDTVISIARAIKTLRGW